MVIGKMGCLIILICNIAYAAKSQTLLALEQAMEKAIEVSPQIKASGQQSEYYHILEKSAWNLPDPELILESPSGAFMALGVEQSMEFPTVYSRQKQLARQQTQVSEKSRRVVEAEVKIKIRQAYLQWQYASAKYHQLKSRDSLYADIAVTAKRQYDAGQIDFVEKSYADVHYTSAHSEWISSKAELIKAMNQIQEYTGISDSLVPSPFLKMEEEGIVSLLTSTVTSPDETPLVDYSQQSESYTASAIRLEKSKALPGFKIGYLNPADKNTPVGMRMRFGLSIPVWFWQYKANINAARTRHEISMLQTEAVKLDWSVQWNDAKSDALISLNALTYLETYGLAQAEEIIHASGRMFRAGTYDYIKYLTTVTNAYKIRENYLAIVNDYNQSLIQLQYLIGQ